MLPDNILQVLVSNLRRGTFPVGISQPVQANAGILSRLYRDSFLLNPLQFTISRAVNVVTKLRLAPCSREESQ
jgi:hypothetical protein